MSLFDRFHCKMMGGNSSSVRMTRSGAASGRSDVKKYILKPTGWGDRDGNSDRGPVKSNIISQELLRFAQRRV